MFKNSLYISDVKSALVKGLDRIFITEKLTYESDKVAKEKMF